MTTTQKTRTETPDSSNISETLRPLAENTEFPVRIYANGDVTTFEVDTRFNGREGTLEFTAGEITAKSAAVLKLKIADTFFDIVNVETEDWRAIREIWMADENKEVVLESRPSTDEPVAETGGVGA